MTKVYDKTLTAEQNAMIERLRLMPDPEIDLSDIPEWTDADFAKATVRYPKSPVSIRLDNDMLEWFRAQGKGYQSRINAVLRAHFEAERDKDK